jgi:hypothetical protein
MSTDSPWPQSRERSHGREDRPDDHRDGSGPWNRQQTVRNRSQLRFESGQGGCRYARAQLAARGAEASVWLSFHLKAGLQNAAHTHPSVFQPFSAVYCFQIFSAAGTIHS